MCFYQRRSHQRSLWSFHALSRCQGLWGTQSSQACDPRVESKSKFPQSCSSDCKRPCLLDPYRLSTFQISLLSTCLEFFRDQPGRAFVKYRKRSCLWLLERYLRSDHSAVFIWRQAHASSQEQSTTPRISQGTILHRKPFVILATPSKCDDLIYATWLSSRPSCST